MRISLRFKLTLIALLLLPVPLLGIRFGAILKSAMLASREESLLLTARAVSTTLNNRPDLFDRELFQSVDQSRDLYLFELSSPIHLNGKINDWLPALKQARTFGRENILSSTLPYDEQSISLRHMVGRRGEYLYALFIVTDDHVVYRNKHSLRLNHSDHLQIGMVDKDGKFSRYLVTTERPGWVNGYLVAEGDNHYFPARYEPRIHGAWSKTEDGFTLEIRIPLALISRKLGFALADVDDPATGETVTLIGTANTERSEELGCLLARSKTIEDILASLKRPQARIWVVDAGSRVRGRFGSLQPDIEETDLEPNHGRRLASLLHRPLQPLYTLFMESYAEEFSDPRVESAKLDLLGIKEGLKGNSSLFKYRIADGKVEVMAAIAPLFNEDRVIGAVVVEQTLNSILALKNRVVEEYIDVTIVAFLVGGLSLILFATRLSSRIRRLRDQAASAITRDGHIRDTVQPLRAGDEIGDLSRTLADMLSQLKQQSEYREKMADNLEHEMRTPLASVSASLKNLAKEMGISDKGREYMEWAINDVRRLEELLTAIRDATTLKEALIRDFPEPFNLDEAIRLWLTHSWQPTFPEKTIVLNSSTENLPLRADPGRIRQLLDKLVENAVDFSAPDTPIQIILQRHKDMAEIRVINHGENMAPEMQAQIFNSMVSIRQHKGGKPHLGLGLFIVRSIVEHYNGTVTASAPPEPEEGAVFTIRIPLEKGNSQKG